MSGDAWIAAGAAAAAHDPLSSMGIGGALFRGLQAADAVDLALGGDADAASRYAAGIVDSLDPYMTMLAAAYAEERRWPDDPFWRSRGRRTPEQ